MKEPEMTFSPTQYIYEIFDLFELIETGPPPDHNFKLCE